MYAPYPLSEPYHPYTHLNLNDSNTISKVCIYQSWTLNHAFYTVVNKTAVPLQILFAHRLPRRISVHVAM